MSDNGVQPEHLVLLGKIDGQVEGLLAQQQAQTAILQQMDARLRDQETKSAKLGALSGGVVSVAIALATEGLKNWVSRGGGHQP